MKKSMLSILLVVVVMLSNVIPASAISLPRETSPQITKDAPYQENAVAHTINLEESAASTAGRDGSVNSQYFVQRQDAVQTRNSIRNHNIKAVAKAKEYVQSLNLSESGLEYIEDACLAELDTYKTSEDTELTSYTVFTPDNSVGLSRSSLPSNMYKYGTYNNVDFYFYYPAEATVNVHKDLTDQTKLQKWINNMVNIGISCLSTELSVTFAACNALWGMPSGYSVHNGEFTQAYAIVKVYTRHIGALSGNGNWIDLTSQQYGNVWLYFCYHTNNTSGQKVYTTDLGFVGQCFSPRYQLGPQELCYEAWQVYMGSWSLPDKLNTNNVLSARFK